MKKIILIAVDAPGPAEFIAPVIPLLKKFADVKIVVVKESPDKILKTYKPIRCDKESDAAKIYKKINPDALLVATSSLVLGPFVNNEFTKLAATDKKKIICFQDYWANHRWPMNEKMMKYWDAMLTVDEMAENFALSDGYKGELIVSGNPALDKLQKVNVERERKKLRKKFKIADDAFVILHSGTGTPQTWREDEITFKFIADGVRSFKKERGDTILISRAHPRDENPGRYKKMAPDLGMPDTHSVKFTEELLPIADVVVGMYATNLIHACYLRIPAISIMLPDAGKKKLIEISLPDFPPNRVGATVGIYEPSIRTLKEEFEKIRSDATYRSFMQAAQTRLFQFGKMPASQKAAEAIKSLL